MKKVSIIIPYFQGIIFFRQTLYSVLKQTYKNYEIIIIYDHDNKNELNLLKNLISKNNKIKLIINNFNIGAGKSRNKGATVAKGKYLAFIDADDVWNKNKLEEQINFMETKKLNFSHTTYTIVDENNRKLSLRKARSELNYKDLLNSCDIGLSTVIMTKKLFDKYKFSRNKTKEDYSLWLKISKKQIIYGLDKNLTKWKKTKNSLSSNIIQKLFDAYDLYYNQEKFNFLISMLKVINLSMNFLKKNYKKK
jgi:teichuronic acid biosynthesis glycosyltransferase TuaG